MKDKRLLGWLLGVAALGCGFAWAQVGEAGSFAKSRGVNAGLAGQVPPAPRPVLFFQEPPKIIPRDEPPKEDQGDDANGPGQSTVGLRKLTPAEINRIRYMELRGMRMKTDQPDRVTVKIPREAQEDFLLEMQGHADFQGERARQNFRKLTAPQKLHQIAYYKGSRYADRVEISSDPEVFIEFKKRVMPVIARSCGTTACHGLSEREGTRFVLFNDPKKSPATTYANFLMLTEMEVNGHQLIDRAQPENSLLLTFMLPKEDVQPELRHPGDVKFKPIFQSSAPRDFRRIRDWIASLKHPSEDYGVHLFPGHGGGSGEGEPPAATQPAASPERRPETQPANKPGTGPGKPEPRRVP